MKIEINEAQARSIARADDVATGETTDAAVDPFVLDQIAEAFPEVRAEFSIGVPMFHYYTPADRISDLSTHRWVMIHERFDETVREVRREVYAAPLVFGARIDEPFVTAVGRAEQLTVLFPKDTPERVKSACTESVFSMLKGYPLNHAALANAQAMTLERWRNLFQWDHIGQEWIDGRDRR